MEKTSKSNTLHLWKSFFIFNDIFIMKSKKGAFANSATGYSKNKYNSNHSKNTHKSSQKAADASSVNKNNTTEEPPKAKLDDVDTEWNSGFGAYLRSGEGVEMMKMFVFANTIMLIITMAWPHFKEQYIWLMQWLESFKEDY